MTRKLASVTTTSYVNSLGHEAIHRGALTTQIVEPQRLLQQSGVIQKHHAINNLIEQEVVPWMRHVIRAIDNDNTQDQLGGNDGDASADGNPSQHIGKTATVTLRL